jgi:ribonuclease HI
MQKTNSLDEIVVPVFRSKSKAAKVYPRTDFSLFFDGCSKGNPGHAGIGAVLYEGDIEIWAAARYIGDHCTNNEAEYRALILGLEQACERNIEELTVFGDSQLVINQVNGEYKVKAKNLFDLYDRVTMLKKCFRFVQFNHVYREQNTRADQLSNIALDAVGSE